MTGQDSINLGFNSTSNNILNQLTNHNVIPIDFHLKLRSAETLTRILSKSSSVKDAYNNWLNNTDRERKITTFTKMDMAFKQIMRTSSRKISLNTIHMYNQNLPPQKEFNVITPFKSEKSKQINEVLEVITNEVFNYIVTTDGSTIQGPSKTYGKTGASAIIYPLNITNEPIILKSQLGTQSNNYAAELEGIRLGLEFINRIPINDGKVLFLVDCMNAITSSFTLPVNRDYNKEVQMNLLLCQNLINQGWQVKVMWIPSHKGFEPNELADKKAKEAATSAELIP